MSANVRITQILLKRGNTAAVNSYTGPVGELVIDTTAKSLRIQDGVTAGGHAVSGGSSNTTITSATVNNQGNLIITLNGNSTINAGHVVGPQGPQGAQGIQGVQGIQGIQGNTGPRGLQGEQGIQGNVGPQGIQGNTGPQGAQGIQGNTGPQGAQGIQGIQGNTGPQGPQGIQGNVGATGPQGIQGIKGDRGDQGISVTLVGNVALPGDLPVSGNAGEAYIVTSTGNLFFWNTQISSWADIGPIVGPRGDKGDTGAQGVQGEKGDQGIQGIQGNVGPMGPQGEQGPAGEQGPQGEQGPKGDQGEPGIPGPQGDPGPKGDQGDPGPQGDPGTQGEAGVGVPAGGTAGQVLAKVDGDDYHTEWVDQTGGSADTANFTFSPGRINYTGDPEASFGNNAASLTLNDNYPSVKLQATSTRTASFNSGAWTGQALWFYDNGQGVIEFIGINSEFQTWLEGLNQYVRVYVSINESEPTLYNGHGLSSGNALLYLVDFPNSDVEVLDISFTAEYENRLVFDADEDEYGIRLAGDDFNIRTSDKLFVFTAGGNFTLPTNGGINFNYGGIYQSESINDNELRVSGNGVSIYTSEGTRWQFKPTGDVVIPGDIQSSSDIDIRIQELESITASSQTEDGGPIIAILVNDFAGITSVDNGWTARINDRDYNIVDSVRNNDYQEITLDSGDFEYGTVVTFNPPNQTWKFRNDGVLYAPDDIIVGATGGRFIQDCADGTTSIRWVNADTEGGNSQLIRVYSDGGAPYIEPGSEQNEKIQLGYSQIAPGVSSFYIETTSNADGIGSNSDLDARWEFHGTGNLVLPQTNFNTSPAPTSWPGITFSDGTFQNSASLQVGDTAPASAGVLWFNTEDARLYVNNGNVWQDASPSLVPGNMVAWTNDSIEFPDDSVQTTAAGIYAGNTAPTAGFAWYNTDDGRTYNKVNGIWVDANPTTLPGDIVTYTDTGNIVLPEGGTVTYANGRSILQGITTSGGSTTTDRIVNGEATFSVLSGGSVMFPDGTTQDTAYTGATAASEVIGTGYNRPGLVRVTQNDANWAFGFSSDLSTTYYTQATFWGEYSNTRGFRVYDNQSNQPRFTVAGSGNVIIGAGGQMVFADGTVQATAGVNPAAPIRLYNEGSGIGIDAYSDTSRVGIVKYSGQEGAFVHNNTHPLRFGRVAATDIFAGNLDVFTDELYIAPNGKIGVNNTNPQYQFHVTGDVAATDFKFANGVSILSTVSGGSYGNTQVAAYLTSQNINSYSNANVAAYLVSNPQAGTYSNTNVASYLTGTITTGNIIPAANVTYDLGSATRQWNSLYVSSNTIYIGGVPISVSGGNLLVNGNAIAASTGTVTFNNNRLSGTPTGVTGTIISNPTNQNGVSTNSAATYFSVQIPYNSNNLAIAAGWIVKFANGVSYTLTSNPDVVTGMYVSLVLGDGITFGTNQIFPLTVQSPDYATAQPATLTLMPNASVTSSKWVFGGNGNVVFPDGTTQSTAYNGYGNTQVAAYLVSNPQPGTYSNSNVASYLVANPQPGTYSNTNVASYLAGTISTGNVNVGSTMRINGTTQTIDTSNGSSINIGSRVNFTGSAAGIGMNVSHPSTFASNLTVQGTGGISIPNRPAFRIYGGSPAWFNTSNVNIKGSSIVVDYNQGNHFNQTTGIFTAPVTGLYSVTLNARVGSNNGSNQILVGKNGLATAGNVAVMWECDTNTGTAVHYGVATTIRLVAGDWLSANVTLGNIQFDQNDSWTVTYIG